MTPRVVLAGNNLAAAYTLDIVLDATTPESVLVLAPAAATRPEWQVSLSDHALDRGVRSTDTARRERTGRYGRTGGPRAGSAAVRVLHADLSGPSSLDAGADSGELPPSLLPRHRGTAPLIWAIAEGDR